MVCLFLRYGPCRYFTFCRSKQCLTSNTFGFLDQQASHKECCKKKKTLRWNWYDEFFLKELFFLLNSRIQKKNKCSKNWNNVDRREKKTSFGISFHVLIVATLFTFYENVLLLWYTYCIIWHSSIVRFRATFCLCLVFFMSCTPHYFVRVIYLYINSENLARIKNSWQPRQIAAEK